MTAAVLAGLAAALAIHPRRTVPPHGWWLALPAVAAGCLLLPPARAVLALLCLSGLLAAVVLGRARVRRRATLATAASVVEACEQLAAELGAGLPAGAALGRLAEQWDLWRPVARAHRIGADVPQVLRELSAAPGAGALRWVAAGWAVAHRTGQSLAATVDGVALDLRASEATRAVVEGELASARATARLMAVLPVAVLLLGSDLGGHPWAFLLATPPGLACLALGGACGATGLGWIDRIAGSTDTP